VASFYFCRSIGGFALEDPTRPAWFLAAVPSDSREEKAYDNGTPIVRRNRPDSFKNILGTGTKETALYVAWTACQGDLIILQTTCC